MQTFVRPSVGAHAKTLEGRWYVSPEVFEEEQRRIFARDWICVGHESRLEQPGDYFLVNLCGESLIIVRHGSGAINAFYNVCRHRGTQLCQEPQGHLIGSIQCPYHAWTYALDGALLAARNMQGIAGFDRADYPLHRAPLRIVEGFLFLTLRDQPETLGGPLSVLHDKLLRWNTAELKEARSIEYDVAANWKLIFQNYSECYHCPVIHPQLDKLSPSDSGRNDFVRGPVLGGYSELRSSASSLTTSGHSSRPPVGAVDGEDVDRVYYYTVFPSMLLSFHLDYVMVHTVEPLAPNRSLITCSWLFDPKAIEAPSFDPTDAVEFWDLTNRQDWHVNELTQRGLSSRAYRPGPYANAEGLLHAFDLHYLSVMR
ncbi:MAG: aromatic ring-hydroxylating dioxygenase subunit alpha [Candidatus Eremiobacteraeota bacterium]|nr:aromatic ring-hydroxylating dioxygenase subunit alpha [Candidatus Eremiobacteraeota bacterium]